MSLSERRQAMMGDHLAGGEHEVTGVQAAPRVLTLYSQPGCHLCEQAHAELTRLAQELGFVLQERDISGEEALHRAYFERIPVVVLDGVELCDGVLDEQAVRIAVHASPP